MTEKIFDRAGDGSRELQHRRLKLGVDRFPFGQFVPVGCFIVFEIVNQPSQIGFVWLDSVERWKRVVKPRLIATACFLRQA